jgi:hypothetical protein
VLNKTYDYTNNSNDGTLGNATKTLSNANYVSNFYCSDLVGNLNNSMNVSFSVAVPVASNDSVTFTGSGATYKPSVTQMENGYSQLLKAGQKVVLQNSEKTIVEIKSVGKDSVSVLIEGKEYSVNKVETTKVDTNSDGYYDVSIFVNEIRTNGYAQVEFKLINEKVPIQEQTPSEEQTKTETPTENSFWMKIKLFFEKIWNWMIFWK